MPTNRRSCPTETNAPQPLTCFAQGCRACIVDLGSDARQADRLRDIGLREGARVCLLTNTDKCILALGRSRIAVQREVAAQLMAEAVSS